MLKYFLKFKNLAIILTVLLFILVLVILIELNYQTKQSYKIDTKAANIKDPKYNIGVSELVIPEVTRQAIKKVTTLRRSAPITTSNFKLIYNYNKNLFIATIYKPHPANLEIFNDWLRQNGYDSVLGNKLTIQYGNE